jgi:hypothetical protein
MQRQEPERKIRLSGARFPTQQRGALAKGHAGTVDELARQGILSPFR